VVTSDDLTLTIHIQRPNDKDPDGYICLNAAADTKDGPRFEDGADGKHDDQTIKRVLLDVHSYFENGRKSWVNLAKAGDKRGRSL
jgi:hypothetical protein